MGKVVVRHPSDPNRPWVITDAQYDATVHVLWDRPDPLPTPIPEPVAATETLAVEEVAPERDDVVPADLSLAPPYEDDE